MHPMGKLGYMALWISTGWEDSFWYAFGIFY
jgi:hypothetical protein